MSTAETTVSTSSAAAEAPLPQEPAGKAHAAPANDRSEPKNATADAPPTTETPLAEQMLMQQELDAILRHHVWGAMGVGLVPLPLIDLVGITGVQINMLRRLAEIYVIPFEKDTVKNVLSALIGSALSVAVAPGLASLVKAIPIIGQTTGAVAMSLTAGASTYAVGKVFIKHFASGGTFLTFNAEKFKAYYTEMFEEGKKFAGHLKKDKKTE
jgi:uncharacterized protein (DUF697 family)